MDEVVFADTGAEKPETYEYLEKWIKPYLKEKGIPYAEVRAKTLLIDRCMNGHTIPDRHFRWSTRDMKINPIKKHLKSKAPVDVYLGICYDEIHRVKQSPIPWITNSWPLVDYRITRSRCEEIIREKGWPIPVKSGCWFCPFQRKSEWYSLWKNKPALWEQSKRIEQNGSGYPNFALHDKTLPILEQEFKLVKEPNWHQETLDECSGYCMT